MAEVVLHFISKTFYTIDVKSRTILNSDTLPAETILENALYDSTARFIDQQMLNGYKIKAVVFSAWTNLTNKSFHDFNKRLFDLCQSKGVFCYFSTYFFASLMPALKKYAVGIEIDEKVLVVDYNEALALVLCRHRDGFKVVGGYTPEFSNFSLWKSDIISREKAKRCIVQFRKKGMANSTVEHVLSSLGPNDFANIVIDLNAFFNDPVVDKVLHVLGEKSNPFDLAFPVRGYYRLYVGNLLIQRTAPFDYPPLKRICVIEKSAVHTVKLFYEYRNEQEHSDLMEEIALSSFKSKHVKITLEVDLSSSYDLKVEPVEDDKLLESVCASAYENVSPLKNFNIPKKFKMVFTKTDFSVQLIHDGKEKVLEDVDGLLKTPIFIAFKEDVPIIGQKARKVFEEAPEYVVFDLIKICSTKSGDKQVIVGDKNSTNGRTAEYTVASLLALILKEAGDRVEKVVGKSLKKVDVGFDGFEAGEILKKNFEEAGKIAGFDVSFV